MTSWIRVPRKLRSEDGPRVRNYLLTLEDGDFTSYYLSLFNAYAFAAANGRELNVYDRSNPVSVSYPLLKDTLEPADKVSYVTEMMSGVTVLGGQGDPRYAGLLVQMPPEVLRNVADRVLQWTPTMMNRVNGIIAAQKLPPTFDIGVHIRSRSRFDTIRAPTTATYVAAVEDAVRIRKLKTPTVFVLVSDPADFTDFARLAPKTWTLFQVSPSTTTIRGSNVGSFNRQNSAIKLNAYVEHVTELYCMQNCTTIVSTLSSNVGKFLYLTAKSPLAFQSLDVQKYS